MAWKKNIASVSLKNVRLEDSFLLPRLEKCRTATIPSSIKRCEETGRLEAFKLNWKEGLPNQPHIYWDSDVAKVMEGMAYILAIYPDKEMEKEYDDLVDLIVSAQGEDGYLNTYFTVVEPQGRWTDLYVKHELYCAGHLIEAAVAGFEALGKRKFLDAAIRYADYIDTVFGWEEGKIPGCCGHPEIELALMRLAHVTGNEKYARLAAFFVDVRGTTPNYFKVKEKKLNALAYQQAEVPVRELKEAFGHAVRATYLFSGMVDTAEFQQDETLWETCERLYENIVNKRMYITGGIGSSYFYENFTSDYDLPNGSNMYAESCAAIALVLFASRLFRLTGEGRYMDIVEKAIYNGVLSGISLSGEEYFYSNYLEMTDTYVRHNSGAKMRQKWFSCSCCPTNFCRFIPQIQSYIWSREEEESNTWFLNMPIASAMEVEEAAFRVEGGLPYNGNVKVTILKEGDFTLALRVPFWSPSAAFARNGEKVTGEVKNGYHFFAGPWKKGDTIEMNLVMEVKVLHAHKGVCENRGKVALTYGPLVYCCETVDNPDNLEGLIIDTDSPMELFPASGLPEGTIAIKGKAYYESQAGSNFLYYESKPIYEEGNFVAIPYSLWQNRKESNMMVWLRSKIDL